MKVASLLFLITFFISCNISNVNKDEIVAEVNGEKIYLRGEKRNVSICGRPGND